MPKHITLAAASLILLAVDWLTFHDLFEPHTVRDYLTLAASLLVFACLAVSVLPSHKVRKTQTG